MGDLYLPRIFNEIVCKIEQMQRISHGLEWG